MKLDEYPSAIAQAAYKLADLDAAIAKLKHRLEQMEADAEMSVQFDSDLKNEGQRKARKIQILTHDGDYQTSVQLLTQTQNTRRVTDIELTLLRDEFTIAKLNLRSHIASQIQSDEAREFVGV